jgi:hypothetical protein
VFPGKLPDSLLSEDLGSEVDIIRVLLLLLDIFLRDGTPF